MQVSEDCCQDMYKENHVLTFYLQASIQLR